MKDTENDIPDSVDEDEPFDPVRQSHATAQGNTPDLTDMDPEGRRIDPEKKHGWDVENFKNNSAQSIVILCLLCIFVFAIIQFIWDGADGGDAMAKASDVFKLIATTALGFLFGRNSK